MTAKSVEILTPSVYVASQHCMSRSIA
jgi:hypothetical protein